MVGTEYLRCLVEFHLKKILNAMKKTSILAALALLSCLPATAATASDEFATTTLQLCDKMKGCAVQQLDQAEGMTEAMKAQIMQGLEMMCVGINQNFSTVARFHALYDPAVACMKSMTALTCEELEGDGADATEECQEYQRLADQYSN
ncbi:hypothetical protein HDIA_3651 [Hartmannibacter diazotrophicus]|uniref:Cysteine rich repeat n=2 Tax=Hartmannibacter diazotrophicus TaxID=1482074 RepID=A0A2C9DA47_9HYPH|nr:hypothetical protein HDIA_3651 [Hartmannibacter diazotrophicus]